MSTVTEAKPNRVSDWENHEVKGQGLACKMVYEDNLERVAALRSRQEAYELSLPKDPKEALLAISKANSGQMDFTEEGNYAAIAALEIVNELARSRAIKDISPDVIFWLTERGLEAMKRIEEISRYSYEVAHQFHELHEPYRA